MQESQTFCVLSLMTLFSFGYGANHIGITCPTAWRNIGVSCLRVFGVAVNQFQTWENAQRLCQGNGGHLVTIDDKLTNAEIGDFARGSNVDTFWIGMNRKDVADNDVIKTHWGNDMDASVYQGHWNLKRPNVEYGDCVYVKYMRDHGYVWQFEKCKTKMSYICQRPSCPSGSFFCHNGKCLSSLAICDTQDDCGDFSDEANCPSNCRTELRQPSGTISSPQSSIIGNTGNYDSSKVCVWTIIGPEGSNIFLNFTRFTTEYQRDIVDIFIGGETETTSMSVAKLSGRPNLEDLQYRSYNHFMIIRFSTDAAVTQAGFTANYVSNFENRPPATNLLAESTVKQFKPNLYYLAGKETYLGTQDYVWIITAEDNRKPVTLGRVLLDLYKGDIIEVHDGDSPRGPLLAVYTHENNDNYVPLTVMNKPHTGPRQVFSTTNKMYVIMRTVKTMQGAGFRFSYWQGCSVPQSSSTGEIFSPGYLYGVNYANYATCTWSISVPNGQKATLFFTAGFDFEADKDYLEVYVDSNRIPKHPGSGFTPTTLAAAQPMHTTDGKFYVKFVTDSITNKKGFHAVYSVDCPNPGFNDKTSISGPQTWRFQDTITVSCLTGYYFAIYESSATSFSMTCQFGGKWNVERIPQCQPIYCGLPPVVNNAFPHANGLTLTYNNYVTYQCYPGYQMTGSANITCQSTGAWTSVPSCSIASCNMPPDINNGQKTISEGNGQEYSSVVRYTCDSGYHLIGAPIAICQSNGQYSASTPVCQKIKCPLPVVLNGQLSTTSIREFGDSITVTCNTGYRRNGAATLTCLAEKTFGTSLPTCDNINECTEGSHSCVHSCDDNGGSYTCSCNDGYTLLPDNRNCVDIDECSPNGGKGPCDQKCNNVGGSYTCSCDVAGYTLFNQNGVSGYNIARNEDGLLAGDVFRINHTCVRVKCPDPLQTINNGVLLNKRTHNRYGDTVEYFCNLGYIINNNNVFKCESNGQWSSTNFPTCSVAQCPPDTQPSNLVNPPTQVSPGVAVNYLDIVNITCNVNGRNPSEFVKERQCLYDIDTDQYKLFGAEYECGVISCGDPGQEPGSNYVKPSNYNYGSFFTFTCSNLYTRKGLSSRNDHIVRCDSNGYWDFETLQCEGEKCKDPHYPAGGAMIATSFEENSVATYSCNRNGFNLDRPGSRICQLNQTGTGLEWNDTVLPSCVDVEKPNLYGIHCGQTINVDPYTVLKSRSLAQALYTDNSGAIMSLIVSPRNANTSLVITGDTSVTYTGTDYAGNFDTCIMNIVVNDVEPPRAVCPQSRVIPVHTSSDTVNEATTTVDAILLASSDNVGIPRANITITPSQITSSNIGTTTVRVVVTDAAGNSDSCSFQVVVKAAPCSPLSLYEPLHGTKNCSSTLTGYECDITCDDTYTIFETGQSTRRLSCQNNFMWSERIPACTKVETVADYLQRYEVVYTAGENVTINENCLDTYKAAFENLLPSTANFFTQICTAQSGTSPVTTIPYARATFNWELVSSAENQLKIGYDVIIGPKGLVELSYARCGSFISTNHGSLFLNLYTLTPLQNQASCPTLTGSWTKPADFETNYQGFKCASFQKKTTIDTIDYCLECPEGMYSTGAETCSLCEQGMFKNFVGPNECIHCPAVSTWYTGATDRNQCTVGYCPLGMSSTDGLPPCNQCSRNLYGVNRTHCEPCPTDTVTHDVGAVSSTQCYSKCPPGSFSYDGYQPNCKLCPENYYQNQEGQMGCIECGALDLSPRGSIDPSNCTAAESQECIDGWCQNNGTCTIQDHAAYCLCVSGYWGIRCEHQVNFCDSQPCYNNGGCTEVIGGYTCSCPTGTDGSRCEVDIDNECDSSPCQNGGMCVNQVDSFRCLCAAGFGGTLCSSEDNICATKPCENNGKCDSIGNIRRKCTCQPGYTGHDCEINIDDCASNPCQHGGECEDRVNGYFCRCPSTYTGIRCQTRILPCNLGLCQSGRCMDDHTLDVHRCLCNEGYKYTGRPSSQTCQFMLYVKTTATTSSSLPAIVSPSPLGAEDCLKFALQPGQMSASDYIIHTPATGDCRVLQQGEITLGDNIAYNLYRRECVDKEDNYWTPWYDTSNPADGEDERRSTLKSTYGIAVCNDTVPVLSECRVTGSKQDSETTGDSFSVSCGQDGLQCQTTACQDYEVRYLCGVHKVFPAGTCSFVDQCNPSPCQHNTPCSSQVGEYTCTCGVSGYNGSMCQHNINNCVNHLCVNGGSCKDEVNTYSCKCPTGFNGPRCANNIQDCEALSCSGHGTCLDGVNGFTCVCSPGYTGSDCSVDIDECTAEPCMHDATCTTPNINDFSCQCPTGYNGKRCETIIDTCSNSQCYQSSTCVPLFGDYFCKCQTFRYGDKCENSPDLCNDLRPCLNQGQCSAVQGQMPTCGCNSYYDGDGCEQKIDHCSTANRCQNGGTCVTLPDVGYRCDCKDGYDGVNCGNNINDCASVSCPTGATCIDMLNAFYCRCPVDKTGEDCARDVDTNYDLFFYSSEKTSYASIPYPIQVDHTDELSLTIWVKFYKNRGEGTFLTIFQSTSSNAQKNPLFALSNEVLTVYYNGQEYKAGYNFTKPNDGKWHSIVVRWNAIRGWDLILDYVTQDSIQDNRLMINAHLWAFLGSKIDFQTMEPIKDQGFNGYLSQFNMYDKRLADLDPVTIYNDPRTVYTDRHIAAWTDFVLHRGVQPVYPSYASKNDCPQNTQCPQKDKEAPLVTSCPSDQYILTSERLTEVSWTLPTFEGAANTFSNYRNGETHGLGRLLVTYEARDESQNAVFCHFAVYVNKYNCTNHKGPHYGSTDCKNSYYPYQGCELTCPVNKRIDRYTPKINTCGPTGDWYPSRRYTPKVFPPCGDIMRQAKKSLTVTLVYPQIPPENCPGIKDAFNVILNAVVKKINTDWSRNMCSLTDCSDIIITITCGTVSSGRRKRDAHETTVKIYMPSTEPLWTNTANSAEQLSGSDVITQYALDPSMLQFNNDQIPGASIDPHGLVIDVQDSCPEGETVIDGSCVRCGPGTFFNATTKLCDFCSIGEYQPADGTSGCLPCDPAKTTEHIGTVLGAECKDICPLGSYYDTTADKCDLCPIGYYQEEAGLFYCDPCPVGTTTRATGSTNSSACYAFCASGTELAPNGTCVPCPVGTFRTAGVQILCESCPTNTTTLKNGSTSDSDCNIVACSAGYKREGTDTCTKCPIGTYQPEKWQTDCISCGGPRYRTDNEASTSKDQCKFFCPSGYQANNLNCEICPVGVYKDNNEDPYSLCKPCQNNLRTNKTGATSQSDCIIFICQEGQMPNGTNNGCLDCPYGTYQPQKEQPSCLPCLGTMVSTRQMGSIRSDQCESYCPSGQEKLTSTGQCVECPIGQYKENTEYKFSTCTQCRTDYVTEAVGSISSDNCTIRDCPVGTKRNADDTGCEDCPRGYFQNLPYQASCTQCQGMTYTKNTKSTRASDCEVYCNSGEEVVDGNCMPCSIGYYKDNNIDYFHTCTLCNIDFITANNGSTSESDCNLANCSAGYERDDTLRGCDKCQKGFYQNEKWQNDCIQCAPQKTTESEGADDISLCILNCDPGYEDVGGVCEKCKRGYFKVERKAAACTTCPTNTTTAIIGATTAIDCNQTYCYPGTYLNKANNNCLQCPYDKYQKDRWMESCDNCPPGKVTLYMGASSDDQCVEDCASGTAYDPTTATCKICPRSYYRDKTDRDQRTCQMCSNGQITPSDRATSSAACNVANCTTPGEYRDATANQCKPCQVGYYNNIIWVDSCTQCVGGYTTERTGSDNVDDCKRDCDSGYEVDSNNVCQRCRKGYFRNKATSWTCDQCPDGLTTRSDAATSEAMCTESPCQSGQYFKMGEQRCEVCPVGQYQPEAAKFTCIQCPDGKYTARNGTINLADCLGYCETDRDNCHVDARCTNDVETGFKCTCMEGFNGNGSYCIHKCDQGYCVNGDCLRYPDVSCVCPTGFQGTYCEQRQDAEAQSQQINRTIIIASISAAVFLMIIIILVVCCIVNAKRRREKRPPQTEYNGYAPDKVSLYTRMSTMPRSAYGHGMAPMGEIGMYDNQGYMSSSRDPAVYEA